MAVYDEYVFHRYGLNGRHVDDRKGDWGPIYDYVANKRQPVTIGIGFNVAGRRVLHAVIIVGVRKYSDGSFIWVIHDPDNVWIYFPRNWCYDVVNMKQFYEMWGNTNNPYDYWVIDPTSPLPEKPHQTLHIYSMTDYNKEGKSLLDKIPEDLNARMRITYPDPATYEEKTVELRTPIELEVGVDMDKFIIVDVLDRWLTKNGANYEFYDVWDVYQSHQVGGESTLRIQIKDLSFAYPRGSIVAFFKPSNKTFTPTPTPSPTPTPTPSPTPPPTATPTPSLGVSLEPGVQHQLSLFNINLPKLALPDFLYKRGLSVLVLLLLVCYAAYHVRKGDE
jgi:hypothetical protein